MKFYVLLLSLLFSSLTGKAQYKIIIQVKDGLTDLGLSGATVAARQSTTKFQKRTNSEGKLVLEVNAGLVQLRASFVGLQPFDSSFLVTENQELNLVLFPQTMILPEVEVKSTRAGDGAPFAKTDLKASIIAKNNLGQDIPFVLNQTPNIVANSDAGNGIGYTGLRIRGSDASRINMTLNGIPFNDPESQGSFFVNIPDIMSSATSVQIQRGVGTSSNGAGAFGGTININTLPIKPEQFLEWNSTLGSFNTYKSTIKFGSGTLGKHFSIDGRLSVLNSDGYIDRAFTKLWGGQFTLGYWGKQTTIKLNYITGKEKTYQAWYGVAASDLKTDRRINYAGSEKPGEPYDNETDNYWQNHYQLFFNHRIDKEWQTSISSYLITGRGYYQQYKANKNFADYNLSGVSGTGDLVRQLWLANKLFGQNGALHYKKNGTAATVGLGWNRYPGNHFGKVVWTSTNPNIHQEWYRHQASKTDFNLFSKYETPVFSKFHFFADLQYRKVHYVINGFRDNPAVQVNKNWNFFNPKSGFSFQQKNIRAFFSYALGNKEPNRDDFEAGAQNQPKFERLHDFELGFSHNHLALENLKGSLTFYHMLYRNQLVLTGKINDVGAYTRTNINASYRSGLETELSYQFRKITINYNGSYNISRIRNMIEYVDNYDNGVQQAIFHGSKPISFSPALVQFLGISFKPQKALEMEWLTKQVSRQFLDNTGNKSRSLDGYMQTDIRFNYAWSFRNLIKEGRLVLQVNNIFNKLYEANGYTFSYIYDQQFTTENYYYPMAGTNWLLSVQMKF